MWKRLALLEALSAAQVLVSTLAQLATHTLGFDELTDTPHTVQGWRETTLSARLVIIATLSQKYTNLYLGPYMVNFFFFLVYI